MDDSLKFQLIAEKIAEIKKSISALSAENLAEHNKRVEEILSVKKMQGEKGDKGDKGDRGEKGDKGEKGESGQDGKDAPYIVSSWIAADNHLMFELSDSTQIDCGSLASQESGGDTFITQKIVQSDPYLPSNGGGGTTTELRIDNGTASTTFTDYVLRMDFGAGGANINPTGTP